MPTNNIYHFEKAPGYKFPREVRFIRHNLKDGYYLKRYHPMIQIYGCSNCHWKYTSKCPHKIGKKQFGKIQEKHSNYICSQRVNFLKSLNEGEGGKAGLKKVRLIESLFDLIERKTSYINQNKYSKALEMSKQINEKFKGMK